METDSITAVLGPGPCVLVRIQGSLNEQMVARKNGQIDIPGDILKFIRTGERPVLVVI